VDEHREQDASYCYGETITITLPVIRSNNLNTCRGARARLPPKLHGEEGEAAWQEAATAPHAPVAIDLFCGAGGLSYGFQEAGFVIALGIDSDADACETHAANLLSRTLCQDVQTIEHPQALTEELGIPRVDVIIGGPPCQGICIKLSIDSFRQCGGSVLWTHILA
jgi:DNA (cytosine-5)-methyltransferase 1